MLSACCLDVVSMLSRCCLDFTQTADFAFRIGLAVRMKKKDKETRKNNCRFVNIIHSAVQSKAFSESIPPFQ